MTISFDNPVWWLLVAALLPLLVHLVARARPKERPFSSIMLMKEILRRQVRRARPRDWLLLLLRTLVCACLAAAFLLPYWGGNAEGGGGRALVLVLDDTASMAAADGQQVRMNRALEVAQAAVRELGDTDRINIATLAGRPRFLFDKPESTRPMAMRELARVQSRPAASAGVQETLDAALRQLRSLPQGMRGRLLLVSDFQKATMKAPVANLLAKAGNADIRCVSVAQAPLLENTAVVGISLSPARPLPGQEVTATVTLKHWSREAAPTGRLTPLVTLSAGETRLSQPCELPRGGQGKVSFRLSAPSVAGSWILSARIEADAFPGDNSRSLAASVTDKLDCLAISQDRAQLGFMLRALENTPFLRTLCLPSLPETPADFVVWNAPSSVDVPAIRARLESGATALVVPDMAGDSACRPLLSGKEGTYAGERRTEGGAWRLEAVAGRGDETFALIDEASLSRLCQAGIYARLGGDFAQELLPGTETLLRYEDGIPALLRRPVGNGCLLVWNMPATTHDSRWGFSPLFLPALAETLKHSRGAESDAAEAVAGLDFLTLKLPAGVDPASVRLVDSEGREEPLVQLPVRAGRSPQLRAENPARPGIYRWLSGDSELGAVVVNFPLEESELAAFAPEGKDETDFLTATEALGRSQGRSRIELWPWLLGAALLFFVIELLVCRRPRASRTPLEP